MEIPKMREKLSNGHLDQPFRRRGFRRAQAGQNVIAVVNARFSELSVKIDAVNSRIDTLQRVIWPLVVLLASTVFGLLYRVFTAGGG